MCKQKSYKHTPFKEPHTHHPSLYCSDQGPFAVGDPSEPMGAPFNFPHTHTNRSIWIH